LQFSGKSAPSSLVRSTLLGKPLDVSVYLDPATNQLVAFRTAKGMLGCLLPWQSVV